MPLLLYVVRMQQLHDSTLYSSNYQHIQKGKVMFFVASAYKIFIYKVCDFIFSICEKDQHSKTHLRRTIPFSLQKKMCFFFSMFTTKVASSKDKNLQAPDLTCTTFDLHNWFIKSIFGNVILWTCSSSHDYSDFEVPLKSSPHCLSEQINLWRKRYALCQSATGTALGGNLGDLIWFETQ